MPEFLNASGIMELIRMMVTDPRAAFRRVDAAGLPVNALWLIFLILSAAGAIINIVTLDLTPEIFRAGLPPMTSMVASMAELFFSMTVLFGAYVIGRKCRGTGRFDQVLAAVCLIKMMSVSISILQIVAIFMMPLLASLLGFVGLVYMLWLMVQLISEVHGFTQLSLVFLGVIFSLLAAFFLFGILLTTFGVKPL